MWASITAAKTLELDAVVHDYNPSTPEVEVGGFQV
jgi:hypothetical protein